MDDRSTRSSWQHGSPNRRHETRSATRRNILELGCLTALGMTSRCASGSTTGAAFASPGAKARNCILIWLDGGPSHLETFDLKPDAPREVRGPLEAIATSTPGIFISECLPGVAQRMQHFSLIRSMTSPLGEHNLGTHYLLTGYPPSAVLDYPAFQSVMAWHQRQALGISEKLSDFPGLVAIPDARVGGANFRSEGFLPSTARPFSVEADPAAADFQVRHLTSAGLGIDRLSRRYSFVERLAQAADSPTADSLASRRPQLAAAFRMATSAKVRSAFDLREESAGTRSRYGDRTIGQSCLLARRLVERGVSMVTVNNRGWDTHASLYTQLKEGFTGARDPVGLIPNLDRALSALIDDLKQTGLLSETLVVVMGEFGRTPKLNAAGGRDHWPRAFSVALAGGGIRGGQVIGSTDRTAESPHERPVTPADLVASLYHQLGLSSDLRLDTSDARSVRLVSEGSNLIPELWGG